MESHLAWAMGSFDGKASCSVQMHVWYVHSRVHSSSQLNSIIAGFSDAFYKVRYNAPMESTALTKNRISRRGIHRAMRKTAQYDRFGMQISEVGS